MQTEKAPDIQQILTFVLASNEFEHVNRHRIICMRSQGAKARAYARIWAMPLIWQKALEIQPFYVIEFLSEHFDHLKAEEKMKVVIHELMHIPKKFSGGLVPHACFGKVINEKEVEVIYERVMKG